MESSKQPVDMNSQAPEVVPSSGLERRYSDDLPETVPQQSETEQRAYYGPEDSATDIPPKYEHHQDEEAQAQRKRRRIFIWTGVATLAVLVIVGAIVGGVVGSQVARKSSNSNEKPSSTMTSNSLANTGLALVMTNSGSRYAYQQLNGGSVIEIPQDANGSWQIAKATTLPINANTGSPLAATAFTYESSSYRALAFVTVDGQVMLTNTTGNGKWATPANVLAHDTADTGSPALALCADTQHLMGMRLYYGSHAGYVRELSYNFNSDKPFWNSTMNFTRSDGNGGVACSLSNPYNHVYIRRNDVGIKQTFWNYNDAPGTWHDGPSSSAAYGPAPNTDIAVTTDGSGTDYIYYRLGNGTVTRAIAYGTDTNFHGYQQEMYVPQGSKFDASYLGSGSSGSSLFLSQSPSNVVSISSTDNTGSTSTTAIG